MTICQQVDPLTTALKPDYLRRSYARLVSVAKVEGTEVALEDSVLVVQLPMSESAVLVVGHTASPNVFVLHEVTVVVVVVRMVMTGTTVVILVLPHVLVEDTGLKLLALPVELMLGPLLVFGVLSTVSEAVELVEVGGTGGIPPAAEDELPVPLVLPVLLETMGGTGSVVEVLETTAETVDPPDRKSVV